MITHIKPVPLWIVDLPMRLIGMMMALVFVTVVVSRTRQGNVLKLLIG